MNFQSILFLYEKLLFFLTLNVFESINTVLNKGNVEM